MKATYHYTSIDKKGKKFRGSVVASNEREAKEKLKSQQMLLLSLSPSKKGEYLESFSHLFARFSKKEHLTNETLISFTSELAHLLEASLPLYESLVSIEEQYRSKPYHFILLSLAEKIKGGESLSKAMSEHPTSFPSAYIAMIRAGESIGALDFSLKKLSELLTKERKLKKQLITALIYPLLLLSFSCVVITLLLTFVLPSIESVFADLEVNAFTRLLFQVSHFFTQKWTFYLPALGVITSIFIYFAKQEKYKKMVLRKLLTLPGIKVLFLEIALARFTRTFGLLLQGGVTMIDALRFSRNVMRNKVLEEIIEAAEDRIIEGSLLSIELKKSPLIPLLMTRLIAIGEAGGNLQELALKIADFYEEEFEKHTSRLLALVQPIILLAMGVIVGGIMIAVLLPLTDVNAFIGGQ